MTIPQITTEWLLANGYTEPPRYWVPHSSRGTDCRPATAVFYCVPKGQQP